MVVCRSRMTLTHNWHTSTSYMRIGTHQKTIDTGNWACMRGILTMMYSWRIEKGTVGTLCYWGSIQLGIQANRQSCTVTWELRIWNIRSSCYTVCKGTRTLSTPGCSNLHSSLARMSIHFIAGMYSCWMLCLYRGMRPTCTAYSWWLW